MKWWLKMNNIKRTQLVWSSFWHFGFLTRFGLKSYEWEPKQSHTARNIDHNQRSQLFICERERRLWKWMIRPESVPVGKFFIMLWINKERLSIGRYSNSIYHQLLQTDKWMWLSGCWKESWPLDLNWPNFQSISHFCL